MTTNDKTLMELGLRQHGIFTRLQALAVGISDDVIVGRRRSGVIVRLGIGVYRVVGFPRSWRSRVMEAVLLGGPTALASHTTAGALRELDGFPEVLIEITVDRAVSRRPDGVIVHSHRRPLRAVDRTVVDSIPCTSLERTLIDVAQMRGMTRAEIALDGAERDGAATSAVVHLHAEELRGRGRTRVGQFSEVTGARVGVSQPTTALERLAVRAIEAQGLPRPECQYPVVTSGRRFTVDLAYPERLLAIELDGRVGHADDLSRQRDAERDTWLRLGGWDVLRFTYRDVRDRPDWMAQRVREGLTRRSSA
ncbi:MAG: DUF559 domain-containing protein [Acidimicrobiia bacterium]